MKTTIDIPEKQLKDAIRYSKAKTKREAVIMALEEFNRRGRLSELLKYSGTCHGLMSNDQIEAMETGAEASLSDIRVRR